MDRTTITLTCNFTPSIAREIDRGLDLIDSIQRDHMRGRTAAKIEAQSDEGSRRATHMSLVMSGMRRDDRTRSPTYVGRFPATKAGVARMMAAIEAWAIGYMHGVDDEWMSKSCSPRSLKETMIDEYRERSKAA